MDEGLLGPADDEDDYYDLPPSIELDEVVLLYRHLLVRLGVHSYAQCLGEGAHGAAFQVEREHGPVVLKLTVDADEAIASAHLVLRPCKHVVRIHRVAGLPDTVVEPHLAQWFVIERELLEPPGDRDKRLLRTVWDVYEDNDDLLPPTGGRMLDRWRDRLRDLMPPTELKRAMWILKDVGLGARELGQKLGLEWSDLHDENVMVRTSGRYVIADPGPGVMTGWREDRPIRIQGFRVGELPRMRPAATAAVAP